MLARQPKEIFHEGVCCMLKRIVCAAAVLTLLISVCLLPQSAAAKRCPVKAPETLLSLYQNSGAIHIATFDKIVDGEPIEETEDYSAIEISKNFTISSTLKGKSEKFFSVEDRDYRYKNTVAEPDALVPDEEDIDADEDANLKSGDTVLLFVRKDDENPKKFVLTDFRDGIKKLSPEKISIYEARIKELNSIFGAKKVDEMRLLEWLIKCADDPVTRWEGTYELLQSVQEMDWRAEAAERRRKRMAEGLPVEEEPLEEQAAEGENNSDTVAMTGDEAETKNFDTSRFAKLLDAGHKQTLANILLNGISSNGQVEEKQKYISGNRELIELVKRWGDPRLIGFLIDNLRAGGDQPGTIVETMEMIGNILDDAGVRKIGERYAEIAYENDDEIADREDAGPDEKQTEQTVENNETSVDGPAEGESKGDSADTPKDIDDVKVKSKTYKDLRSELLQRFIDRCGKVINQQERPIGEDDTR